MLVDLSRVSDGVIRLECADEWRITLRDLEGCSWYNDIGGVCSARPFLAIGAVAEGSEGWLAWKEVRIWGN